MIWLPMVIGIVQWIILITDLFTEIYKQIIISASFTVIGFPLYVYDDYWRYKDDYGTER